MHDSIDQPPQWQLPTSKSITYLVLKFKCVIGLAPGQADPFDATNPCLDYVTILGGSFTNTGSATATSRDRYCGIAFPTEVKSKFQV